MTSQPTKSLQSTPAITQEEIERAVALGRQLHAEALRNGLRRVFALLFAGPSPRHLRRPGRRLSC
jgi:hypothetical protein